MICNTQFLNFEKEKMGNLFKPVNYQFFDFKLFQNKNEFSALS